MKPTLRPMWDDPEESPVVRELVRAGRAAGATDYDLKAGLFRHLGHIKAGTPPPAWADQMLAPAAGAAASGASIPLWGWLAVSVLGAASGVYVWSDEVWSDEPGSKDSNAVHSAEVAHGTSAVSASLAASVEQPAYGVTVPDPVLSNRGQAVANERVASGIAVNRKRVKHRVRVGRRSAMPGAANTQAANTQDEFASASAKVENVTSGASVAELVTHSKGISAAPSDVSAARTELDGTTAMLDEASERPVTTLASASDSTPGDKPQKVRPGASAEPAVATSEAQLEREMRMLKVAQANLETDPARSLRLAEMGEREFADSLFTQERQYVLIVALARLGRTGDAHRLAASYLKRYPTGPFSERVRKALGNR